MCDLWKRIEHCSLMESGLSGDTLHGFFGGGTPGALTCRGLEEQKQGANEPWDAALNHVF